MQDRGTSAYEFTTNIPLIVVNQIEDAAAVDDFALSRELVTSGSRKFTCPIGKTQAVGRVVLGSRSLIETSTVSVEYTVRGWLVRLQSADRVATACVACIFFFKRFTRRWSYDKDSEAELEVAQEEEEQWEW
ncbi:unnamed protein product, partial [Mesorhabditis spiculigera]